MHQAARISLPPYLFSSNKPQNFLDDAEQRRLNKARVFPRGPFIRAVMEILFNGSSLISK